MKGIYLAILLTIYTWNVLLVTGIQMRTGAYCFQYTWPGATITDINCTEYNEKHAHIPCINPIYGEKKPDTNELWKTPNDLFLCRMEPGNVCVRYTFIYNSAVMNVSYFCGKVIEDQATAVTSGCYIQYVEGYAIEACACKSSNATMPCNSAKRNTYSILISFMATTISMFVYKIFDIP